MSTRILVIEDNSTNLELMIYLLQAFGYTALSAQDGAAGLEIARRESPDLIVCDVQLPGMDGYEVVRQLKTRPALREIPVVAVTALAMVGDKDRVLGAGFNGYISKPIVPETFVTQLEDFLKTKHRTPYPQQQQTFTASAQTHQVISATILVVDNSPVNISLARSVLEPFGYEIIAAGSVTEALELARRVLPDLILSDVHMPKENGYDLIRAVKADPQLKSIPFVFISSTVRREEEPMRGLVLGATKFILRPIEPEALLAEIESCLLDKEKEK